MFVGMASLSLVIGGSHSLKEKRMVLRRIKDRVRERLGIVVSEVGDQDIWQRAELGVAVVSGDRGKALELLDNVVRVAMAAGGSEIVAIKRSVVRFEGEDAPVPEIDDRTGSGDKAVASDGWVPDAWRDEVKP